MAKTKTINLIRDEEHVISEANGRQSREQILLDSSIDAKVLAGTILGRMIYGAVTVASAAAAGNTGNGTMAALPTADAGAAPGVYVLTIIEPAANAGAFVVERPDGVQDGHGNVAAAYNGTVNFTLQDGATDFVAGDRFNITVSYADAGGRYLPLDLTAVDGTQIACAVLAPTEEPTDPATHVRTSAHVRDCEVNGNKVFWPDGITDQQKATAEAQLATSGILVRY